MITSEPDKLLIREAMVEDDAQIRDFLLESSDLYPDIESWWKNTVSPSIERGGRTILVVDDGESIEGLFIGKPGKSAKLCTLRLRESIRNQGVGRTLVTEGLSRLMASSPSRFHVTISEAAEEGCTEFFESVGFRHFTTEKSRYSPGVDEFIYACPESIISETIRNELAMGVDQTLFGSVPLQMPHEQTLLMSLKPQFAELMLKGIKTVEFRRRFSKKYEGATIVFYITRPVGQFMFTANIAKVNHSEKNHLWCTHEREGGVSKVVFDEYFAGTNSGYAISLTNIRALPNPLLLKHAQVIDSKVRAPQSFQKIDPESPLLRAFNLPVNL